MTSNDDDAFDALLRKLERLGNLTDDDRRTIRNLPFEYRQTEAGTCLVQEGERATTCYLLLTGYVCRHKTASAGHRQIVSFHVPGDIVDLQHLLLSMADHSIQAITDVRFAAVPAAEIRRAAQNSSTLAETFWRDTMIDASVFREWVLNVGRRDAKSRVAHMLCEFAVRREAAGLGSPSSVELPMTQEDIADATGLTNVHVNRMLAQMAGDGLIRRHGRQVEIVDWAKMQQAADFDAAYLHVLAA